MINHENDIKKKNETKNNYDTCFIIFTNDEM